MIINHFFDQPAKSKRKAYDKLAEMSRHDDYATGKLLDYMYYWKYYKLTGCDLSRRPNASILQKNNFTGKLDKDDGPRMFFITKEHQKTTLNFSLIVTE